MSESKFVYVTYIRAPREKVWEALTRPEFQRAYWFGVHHETDWKPGGAWRMLYPDGRVADSGEVLEFDPPRRLALKWRNEWRPELREEGYSRCVMELEEMEVATKLTVTHTIDRAGAKFIEAVAGGWPKVLSSLKSLLETGTALPAIPDPSKR